MRAKRFTQRIGRATVFLAVAALLLAARGGDDEEVAAEPDPSAEELTQDVDADEPDDGVAEPDEDSAPTLDPVDPIQMGSIAIPPIFSMLLPGVADEAGFFGKYNVDVTLRSMETGVDAARAVQGGDLDVAFSPTGPVMNFAGTGVDVAALMGLDNIDWLIGSKNPEVDSCEALEGETIAVDSVGGARYNVLQVILRSCDLTIEDVDVASFPGAVAIQAIAAGQLDTGVIHIDDIYNIQEQGGAEMNTVLFLADIDPMQHYLVFWTLRDSIDQNREAYVRVLAAMIDATRFITDPANEDEVVRIGTLTGHSEDVVRASLADFLELEYWPVDRDGLPQDKLEAAIATQVRLENMAEEDAPDFEDVVDLSLWAEAFELVESMN